MSAGLFLYTTPGISALNLLPSYHSTVQEESSFFISSWIQWVFTEIAFLFHLILFCCSMMLRKKNSCAAVWALETKVKPMAAFFSTIRFLTSAISQDTCDVWTLQYVAVNGSRNSSNAAIEEGMVKQIKCIKSLQQSGFVCTDACKINRHTQKHMPTNSPK